MNNNRLEHHSRNFFAIEGEKVHVRQMESLAIAAKNGDSRVAYVAMSSEHIERVLGDNKLRMSLVRDVNRRSAAKLRAMQ